MLPKSRISRTRKRIRRSHHALTAADTKVCAKCGNPKSHHTACPKCGFVREGLTIKTSEED